MNIEKTDLPGAYVIETNKIEDSRGSFSRLFCYNELSDILGERKIVQINHSKTLKKGAIRGMHYQCKPAEETKMVRCLKGKVFDVALDLRKDSKTFLQWHAEELTPENGRMLVIPEGCAHGFQVMEAETELLYLHTEFYQPEYEGGVLFNDTVFNINWPLECTEISDRDRGFSRINRTFQGLEL